MFVRLLRILLPLTLVLLALGCSSPAADALRLDEDHAALRQLQVRRFDTQDEAMMLRSASALLQDLGFVLDDSETDVGLLNASKARSAVNPGEVAAAVVATIVISVIGALAGGSGNSSVAWDDRQLMRACVVTYPTGRGICVRVTFQRTVWNNEGRVSKHEALQEPEHYEEFFSRLSQAVFLEAHEL